MDLQSYVNAMNEVNSKERSGYHLTYGELMRALKAAPEDATFDERVNGIGSYRGYYVDIALFTLANGYIAEDEEYTGDYGKDFEKWREQHVSGSDELPTNANELGALLESLIGKDFTGYKGGNFTITEDKPLWLEDDESNCSGTAVIGIDENLKLITKVVD